MSTVACKFIFMSMVESDLGVCVGGGVWVCVGGMGCVDVCDVVFVHLFGFWGYPVLK